MAKDGMIVVLNELPHVFAPLSGVATVGCVKRGPQIAAAGASGSQVDTGYLGAGGPGLRSGYRKLRWTTRDVRDLPLPWQIMHCLTLAGQDTIAGRGAVERATVGAKCGHRVGGHGRRSRRP